MFFVLIAVILAGVAALAVVLVGFRRQETRAQDERRAAVDAVTRSRALAESDLALLRTDLAIQSAQLHDMDEVDPALASPLRRELNALSGRVNDVASLLAAASDPAEVESATATMSDVRADLVCIASQVVGDPEPDLRSPCFFNPNHGPSSTIVVWRRPGQDHVRVPCCAADAERLRSGAAPYSRTVATNGVRVPWWESGPTVRPWAMGWFARWQGTSSDLARSFPALFTNPEAPQMRISRAS